jgi:sortase A
VKKRANKFLPIIISGIVSVFAGIYLILLPAVGGAKVRDIQDKLIGSLDAGDAVYADGIGEPGETSEPAQPAEAGGFDVSSAISESLAEKEIFADLFGRHPMYCIGILSIPKIDVMLPVVEGLTEENLKYALAHMYGSSAIGEEGSCCIFGHRSYAYGKFFNRLDELEEGDAITIETAGGMLFEYAVENKEILLPDDPLLLDGGMDGKILSLITCHPVRVASHRLVIRARLNSVP